MELAYHFLFKELFPGFWITNWEINNHVPCHFAQLPRIEIYVKRNPWKINLGMEFNWLTVKL